MKNECGLLGTVVSATHGIYIRITGAERLEMEKPGRVCISAEGTVQYCSMQHIQRGRILGIPELLISPSFEVSFFLKQSWVLCYPVKVSS